MAQPTRGRATGAVLAAALAGLAVAAARRTALRPVRVAGDSMAPTVPDGALVAVAPRRRDPPAGAVVVVRRPDGAEHLKRVVGAPGERGRFPDGTPFALGPDEFAVAGDNSARSTDSRHYGPVRREDVVAVAVACYWPPRAWRLLGRARRRSGLGDLR
jgi:signal peptidase I